MRILGLLQSFNSEQEKQNHSFKSKIQAFQQDLDKKYRLFKAYTAHDSLVSKLDSFDKKLEQMATDIKQNEEQHITRIQMAQAK